MRSIFLTLLALSIPAWAETVSLFDGKTLDGWETRSPQLWKVEEGCITGGNGQKVPHNDFICTRKSFSNFTLKLKIKLTGDPATGLINSGVQIRTLRNPEGHEVCGYQCDYGEPNWYGGIYDEGRRNKFIAPADMKVLRPAIKLWEWNDYKIKAEGNRIQTWINGVPGVDYKETDPNIPFDGIIGVQVHGGGNTKVQLKDITIEELPPTKEAPTWEKLGGVEGVLKKLKEAAEPVKSKRDISYNDVSGTAKSAEEQQKLFHLPDGYEIELVLKESEGIGKFVSVAFDQRGRLWTQTALEYPLDGNENPAAAEAVYAARSKDKILVYPREAVNNLPPGGLTNPTVFADGLAIPLGVLPWGNGDRAYILHGHDIIQFTDTDGDGKSDKREVMLTGFGVQDSHLFPHQFTRAPGNWLWMAQGAFNSGNVLDRDGKLTEFPSTRMARFRPDGTNFEITSQGPCNIWGLVMTGEGETFIQEANDYGYPVMPFHDYGNYPGCADRLFKSYAPHFPVQAPDFKMGGTGLSGLALGEGGFRKLTPSVKPDSLCMFVANPIISKVQTLVMHREDSRKFPREAPNGWRLEQAPDLITCDDPMFRPVAMTNGPDGCIYIIDWYNKIISHNEVPRNHPDRDKLRGRIWRVKPKADKRIEILDYTNAKTDDLIAQLGKSPVASAHLAWQTLADRAEEKLADKLSALVTNGQTSAAQLIQSLWALEGSNAKGLTIKFLEPLLAHAQTNVRREAARVLGNINIETSLAINALAKRCAVEQNSTVKFQLIQELGILTSGKTRSGKVLEKNHQTLAVQELINLAQPSLAAGPTAPGRSGKPIPVGEAYDREYERYLVRLFLERNPATVAKFLDSAAATKLSMDALVLASLALDPKSSASRVAKILPKLDRSPNDEELLRLAQFPEEAGCGDALKALLSNAKGRAAVAEKLLAQKTKLDPAKISPLLNDAAKSLLAATEGERSLGVSLIGAFQLASLEPELVAMVNQNINVLPALQALRELRSSAVEVFAKLVSSTDPMIRDEALAALSYSSNPQAAEQLFGLYPTLNTAQQRAVLNALSATKPGAKAIVTALTAKRIPTTDLDGPTAERLSLVLGNDPDLANLMKNLGHVFHDVLAFDGQDSAVVNSKITLDGPFTVECWVRLAPGINNEDGLLGSPDGIDLNFYGSQLRVYAGSTLHDVVVAKKPMTPDLWTHLAVTRDAAGLCKIYQNGELDAVGTKPAPAKFENCSIGWSGPKKGTEGMMTEFRVWNRERSAAEIRANFDRADPANQVDLSDPKKLGKGARMAKTTDYPPILTKEQSDNLDKKFAHFSALGQKPGNAEKGKLLAAICTACHTINGAGGQIGPNLSGAGAMGLEGVLRNIMTPNAAMEAGYRIFRVEMKSGDIVEAFFVSEDKEAVVIRQPGLQDRRIPKKEIRATRYIRRSLMPEGLLDAFNDEQVTDLMAYLMTLK